MPALGISKCPPFLSQNIVPGVLYDGNTVAWYKYNDPIGVVKDGANAVSVWFDKMNYSLGAELIDQNNWYKSIYWNRFTTPPFSTVGNTISVDGTMVEWTQKNGFLTIGKLYKVAWTMTRTAGSLFIGDTTFSTGVTSSVTGSFVSYFVASTANLVIAANLNFAGVISALSIKEVGGKNLLQFTGASQPVWSAANGVLFDGVNDFMKAKAFAFAQPEFVYFVGRQVTWTFADYFFDGNGAGQEGFLQQALGASPAISSYAGLRSADDNGLILNTFSVVRCLFNGANSTLQVNNNVQWTGNNGASNMGGFTLGCSGILANYGNVEAKEIILRRTADNANVQTLIYNYLKNINNVP